MLKRCPDSVDVTDLQFKLSCRLKVFDNNNLSVFTNPSSLVSCASRYGLLFVGSNDKRFQVIQTQKLHTYSSKDKDIKDYPRRTINIPSAPKHISCNCDSTILAVIVEKEQCPVVIFYEVLSFLKTNIKIIKEVRLSASPNVHIREVNWNPSIPGIFTACKNDGTLGVYELRGESIEINELPAASGATCFCWSPKGKQIAVGSINGNITQYKPDLKAVKIIPEPKLEVPHSLINVYWISNYQFIGIYQQKPDGSTCVIVIDAPKSGEPSYTNYDDICYSGSSRPPQFYLIYQQNWNFLMVASGNSTEIGVLGNVGDSWTQWNMPDYGRAELPLSSDYQETFPIGLSLDISSTTPMPWSESTIPPCPVLCILSHQGVLCCFHVVYLKPGIPSICTPPDSISDQSGLNLFVATPSQGDVKQNTPIKTQFQVASTESTTASAAPKMPFAFHTPVQSTPLMPEKIGTGTIMFGEKASLTPIKNSTIFGGQSLITPINKAITTDSNTTAVSTEKSIIANEKYSTIFSALNSSASSQVTTPVKPVVITATNPNVLASKPEATIENKPSQEPTNTKKEMEKPEIIDPEIKAETAAMLNQMIKEEWDILDTELLVLLKQCRSVKINVGTDQEMINMVELIEHLENFTKEAIDISLGQSSEIHGLKQNLIQAWAWFEEARSHYNASKNETIALLQKLQPLDSVAEKNLKDIQQLVYYIESQLSQANKALDEQWGNFQDYASKTYKVKMPTMETIFQTMVRQSAILQRQTYVLKDISMRLKKKSTVSSSLLLSLDKTNELAEDLKNLHLTSQDVLQIQYEKIRHHTKSLTANKVNKLRTLLKQQGVTNITAVKPQSSWTMNQSSASKIRQSHSILGAHMSPVSKVSVARNLDFIQSTPQKEPTKVITTDLKQLSIDSTPQKSNLTPATTGFISLAKSGSGISSSTQGSAFVPTGSAAIAKDQENKTNQSSILFTSIPKSAGTFIIQPTKAETTAQATANLFSSGGNTLGTKLPLTSTAPFTMPQVGQVVKTPGSNISSPLNLVKTIQSPTSTGEAGIFGSHLFSFGSTSAKVPSMFSTVQEPGSKTVNETTKPETGTIPKTGNLFTKPIENSQSRQTLEIDKEIPSSNILWPSSKNTITTTSTSSPGLFGSISKSTAPNIVTQPSFFGISAKSSSTGLAPSTTSAPSVLSDLSQLGLTGNVATSSTPFFGTTTTTTNSFPLFGSGTSSSPLFSGVSSSTKFFGETLPTSIASSPFGISTPAATSAPLFGGNTASASLAFGGLTTKSSTSSFEITAKTAAPSVVGDITTSSSLPLFGGTGIPTGSTSIFGGSLTVKPVNKLTASFENTTVNKTISDPVTSSVFSSMTPANSTADVSSSTLAFGNTETINNSIAITATSNAQATPLFGNVASTSSSLPSLFGTTPNVAISENNPSFGNIATKITSDVSTTIFSSPPKDDTTIVSSNALVEPVTSSILSTPSSSSQLFQAPSTNSTAVTTASSMNIFGQPVSLSSPFSAPTTTSPNIFNNPPAKSSFGPAPASTTNIFAGSTSTSFSNPTTSSNIFSQSTTPETNPSNVFGTANTTPSFGTQNNSLFATNKSQANVFGPTSSVFGNQATSVPSTTASSLFVQSGGFSAPSVFGTPTTTASASIFGSPSEPKNAFGSGFGAPPTAAAPPFPASTSSTTTFGFGSLSVDSTSGNIFGGSSSGFEQAASENPFGKAQAKQETNFGPSGSSIFGKPHESTATTNIFGTSTTITSPIFGSNSGSAFGSSGGNFGSQNTFNSSPFGQSPGFGSPSFGSTQNTGAFSGGGTSSASPSGFASPNIFQKPSGFGSPPVFGGSPSPAPAFGAAPTFGGTPSYGSAPTFGTPEKVFGGTQSPGGFGSMTTQQNAGFGNLASQNTIGFGNLAQQAKSPSSMQFSGGASFSSWR